MKDTVYIACPTYNGEIRQETATRIFLQGTVLPNVKKIHASSALTMNMNQMYAEALDMRDKFAKDARERTDLPDDKKHNLKWFAMCHADIVPEEFWIDKLIKIAEAGDIDFLSCVVPIKDDKGISSTAIEVEGIDHFPFMRISQAQIWDKNFPVTFTKEELISALTSTPEKDMIDEMSYSADQRGKIQPVAPHLRTNTLAEYNTEDINLLLNTGCMIMRLDKEFSDKVFFHIANSIIQTPEGKRVAYFYPEDWFVSRLIAKEGGRIAGTKAIRVTHYGVSQYNNFETWGDPIDRHCPDAKRHEQFRQD